MSKQDINTTTLSEIIAPPAKQITALRAKAGAAGDDAMVWVCDAAMRGDIAAIETVIEVLAAARARRG